jgi:hypothetical protein
VRKAKSFCGCNSNRRQGIDVRHIWGMTELSPVRELLSSTRACPGTSHARAFSITLLLLRVNIPCCLLCHAAAPPQLGTLGTLTLPQIGDGLSKEEVISIKVSHNLVIISMTADLSKLTNPQCQHSAIIGVAPGLSQPASCMHPHTTRTPPVAHTQESQGRPHMFCDMRIVDDAGKQQPHDGKAVGHLQVWASCIWGEGGISGQPRRTTPVCVTAAVSLTSRLSLSGAGAHRPRALPQGQQGVVGENELCRGLCHGLVRWVQQAPSCCCAPCRP